MGFRVLIVDGREDLFERVKQTLAALGHETVVEEADIQGIGRAAARVAPDVAIVLLQESRERTLATVRQIVREASCPVIALIDAHDPEFIDRAAAEGIFAYLRRGDDEGAMRSCMEIAIRRFGEYHALESAFTRRAVTERAKGILMERHRVGEEEAFAMLRDQARRTQRKVIDVAEAILVGYSLLPGNAHSHADA